MYLNCGIEGGLSTNLVARYSSAGVHGALQTEHSPGLHPPPFYGAIVRKCFELCLILYSHEFCDEWVGSIAC